LYVFPAGETVHVFAESGISHEAIESWAGKNNVTISFVGDEEDAKWLTNSWLVYKWVPTSEIGM